MDLDPHADKAICCPNKVWWCCILQGPTGAKATTMITELIRDNRKIIDRIPHEEIHRIIQLVKRHKVRKSVLMLSAVGFNLGWICFSDG